MNESNPQQLEQYRLKLMRDAGSGNKPERTPNLSFFVTWKITDAGYKFSEALSNYDIMEKVVRYHYEQYQPDMMAEFGTRNPYMLTEALGSSNYVVDDEHAAVGYREIPMATHEQLKEIADNPKKFIWEKGMAAKFSTWNENFTIDDFRRIYAAYCGFGAFAGKMGKIMKEEYGIPSYTAPKAYCYLGVEYLFNHIRSIKGFSVDLRKDPSLFQAAIDSLQEIFYYPSLEALKSAPAGKDMSYCFDYSMDMLAQTVMSNKQFEQYYLPYLEKVINTIADKNMTMRLFIQGNGERFYQYLKDYPKGTIAIHSEHDDLLQVRKNLPNCANIGGLPVFMLGNKSKQACLDRTKLLIDTLGADGGLIISQDKQVSYKNDCKAENYKAVCEFIREYTPSQN